MTTVRTLTTVTRTFAPALDAAHCSHCGEHFAFHYAGFACDRPTPADRIHAAYDAAVASDPVRTDDVLEARNAALLDMLAAVLHGTKGHRSLVDRGGFMTPDRQQLLDRAEALVVEIRG